MNRRNKVRTCLLGCLEGREEKREIRASTAGPLPAGKQTSWMAKKAFLGIQKGFCSIQKAAASSIVTMPLIAPLLPPPLSPPPPPLSARVDPSSSSAFPRPWSAFPFCPPPLSPLEVLQAPDSNMHSIYAHHLSALALSSIDDSSADTTSSSQPPLSDDQADAIFDALKEHVNADVFQDTLSSSQQPESSEHDGDHLAADDGLTGLQMRAMKSMRPDGLTGSHLGPVPLEQAVHMNSLDWAEI